MASVVKSLSEASIGGILSKDSFAEIFDLLRKRKGWTVIEAAKKLRVSRGLIYNLIAGKTVPEHDEGIRRAGKLLGESHIEKKEITFRLLYLATCAKAPVEIAQHLTRVMEEGIPGSFGKELRSRISQDLQGYTLDQVHAFEVQLGLERFELLRVIQGEQILKPEILVNLAKAIGQSAFIYLAWSGFLSPELRKMASVSDQHLVGIANVLDEIAPDRLPGVLNDVGHFAGFFTNGEAQEGDPGVSLSSLPPSK